MFHFQPTTTSGTFADQWIFISYKNFGIFISMPAVFLCTTNLLSEYHLPMLFIKWVYHPAFSVCLSCSNLLLGDMFVKVST